MYRNSTEQQQNTHFFPTAKGTLTKTDHNLGHKMNCNSFVRIEIIHCMFSDNNGMSLKPVTEIQQENLQTLTH